MAEISSLLSGLGGGAIGQAIVRLELDTAKYQAEMKTAQASTVASTNSMSSGLGKFQGFAQAAFLGVGVAAVAGVAVAVKAASDLNEQINKTKVVFEDSADSVLAFSETTAESLGIAQSEALEAAGGFGQLFDAAGLATSAAAEMSQKMVTLGADLGSFNNIPVAEALEKIRGGLSGEAEPLRVLGVFLSEARVEAEAFSSGIAKVGTELTDAQKIQARYNIILNDTKKAQGDFGRTVGTSIPNQLKVLKAEFTDTAAELGTQLLPALLDLLGAVQDLTPVFKGLFAIMVNIVSVAADFVKAITDPVGVIREGQEAWHTQVVTLERLSEQYRSGKIDIIEFDTALRDLKAETGINTNVTQEYLDTLQSARDGLTLTAARAELHARRMELAAETTREAGKALSGFANKTADELEEWSDETKESFRGFVLSLERTTDATIVTRREFIQGTRDMLERARDLDNALRQISKEKWVNDEYLEFLADLGPDKLIAFSKLTDEKAKQQQDAWEKTTGFLKNSDRTLEAMIGTLDKLDKGESKHKIILEYEYVGFDPTKPGMGSAGHGGPQ